MVSTCKPAVSTCGIYVRELANTANRSSTIKAHKSVICKEFFLGNESDGEGPLRLIDRELTAVFKVEEWPLLAPRAL